MLQPWFANSLLRFRYENEISAIRNAVVGGEFQWLGEGGLFIQGELRKGLEPRIVRSDMKEMEELVEKEARRLNKTLVDPSKKLALDAYFQVQKLRPYINGKIKTFLASTQDLT